MGGGCGFGVGRGVGGVVVVVDGLAELDELELLVTVVPQAFMLGHGLVFLGQSWAMWPCRRHQKHLPSLAN